MNRSMKRSMKKHGLIRYVPLGYLGLGLLRYEYERDGAIVSVVVTQATFRNSYSKASISISNSPLCIRAAGDGISSAHC